MRREVKVGTISWINRTPNPITTTIEALALEPAWVVKTCIGLAATANADPGDSVGDFVAFQRSKHFRALMYCHIAFDEDTARGAISGFQVLHAVHDPGWTPPFSQWSFPTTFLKPDANIWSWSWHQGEASPLSVVNTQARHRNTAITGVGADEIVLVNGLIKFRAGKHTDDAGVNDVGAPFHVPWVWCEMLLTYVRGTLKLYGRGSLFPTHGFYLDGRRVARRTQDLDTSFPRTRVHLMPNWMPRLPTTPTLANPLQIDARAMVIYPVLAAGAPASGPQVALSADAGLTTPVDQHPYTASGFATIAR